MEFAGLSAALLLAAKHARAVSDLYFQGNAIVDLSQVWIVHSHLSRCQDRNTLASSVAARQALPLSGIFVLMITSLQVHKVRKKKNVKGESVRLEVKLLNGADLVMELVRARCHILPYNDLHNLSACDIHVCPFAQIFVPKPLRLYQQVWSDKSRASCACIYLFSACCKTRGMRTIFGFISVACMHGMQPPFSVIAHL